MNDSAAATPHRDASSGKDEGTHEQRKGWTSVELAEPIKRGETRIERIDLRKPRSGELRGLSLQDVIGTDIAAILKLVPRISEPPLTAEEADRLDPADLAEIGGAIRGFFMTTAEKAMLDTLIAEQQPRS